MSVKASDISQDLTQLKKYKVTVLLVDDQEIIAEAVRRMLDGEDDIDFYYCQDPTKAIEMAMKVKPTVILQDLVMPEIDGLMLVKYFRANPETAEVPMVVLSSKEDAITKAEAFALGANDYMVKLPDRLEVLARVRYHSKGYISQLERNEAYSSLKETQRILQHELQDAATYVMSLLPKPLVGEVTTTWRFEPSLSLAGDTFGYHWVDDLHFAIYLLDVCNHGIGPALHSISVINLLRSQSLNDTDFFDPSSVLYSLNNAFLMEDHNNMFFTMWYGIYNKESRELLFSSGGHPPAILINGETEEDAKCLKLTTPGLVIGGMEDMVFQNDSVKIGKFNKLFVYSDGIYELDKPDGTMVTVDELAIELAKPSDPLVNDLDRLYDFSNNLKGEGPFPDDYSVIKIVFE